MYQFDNSEIERNLAFRNYLLSHPVAAKIMEN
ncbi:hypothetical protein [Metabacillus fastidiosus]|nr:hypothetical protein [Metabacillus fastidiosus]MED4461810.1 hypothetical protein [Metabacillus fastidiosus]